MLVKELLEQVGSRVKTSHEDVAKRVADQLVEKEIAARTAAFINVLSKLDELRKAANKIKPDSELFPADETGAPGTTSIKSYSKAKKEELDKNKKEQEKLEAALNKALEGDFSKVMELGGKGGAAPAAET